MDNPWQEIVRLQDEVIRQLTEDRAADLRATRRDTLNEVLQITAALGHPATARIRTLIEQVDA